MSKKQVLSLTVFTATFGLLLLAALLWGVIFGESGSAIFSSAMPAVIWVLSFLAALATVVAPLGILLYYPAEGFAGATATPAAEPGAAADEAVVADDEILEEDEPGFEADSQDDGTLEGDAELEDDGMFEEGYEDDLDDFEDEEDYR